MYKDRYPYWYFAHVTLAAGGVSLPQQYIIRELKIGYDYLLEGFTVSYPADARGGDICPAPRIEVIQTERGRPLTQEPILVHDMTSPGESTAGNQTAKYTTYIPFNYLISNKDVLQLRVAAQAGGNPATIDILIFGTMLKRGIVHEFN